MRVLERTTVCAGTGFEPATPTLAVESGRTERSEVNWA